MVGLRNCAKLIWATMDMKSSGILSPLSFRANHLFWAFPAFKPSGLTRASKARRLT